MVADEHRTAERRSLALHVAVAAALDDAEIVGARARIDRRVAEGGPTPSAIAWQELLSGPRATLAAALVRDDDVMRDLRQDTPFAGVVPARERWRIIRETR